MKKISIADIPFIPASHEDQTNPAALKKILFTDRQLNNQAKVKMINWARIKPGKSFRPHYHEDMDEIFIITSGTARIKVESEEEILKKGDAVLISMNSIHHMEDIGGDGVEYIVIGLSLNKRGKTVITKRR